MPALIFVVESNIEVCRQTRCLLEEMGYGVRAFLTTNIMEELERNVRHWPSSMLPCPMAAGSIWAAVSARHPASLACPSSL